MNALVTSTRTELTSATTALEARLQANSKAKWDRVWAASGIRVAVESMESVMGDLRPRGGRPDSMTLGDEYPVVVGEIVCLRDDYEPTRLNQFLVRVAEVSGPGPNGGRHVTFGAMLPRSEWPEAMREATAPTSMSVQSGIGMAGYSINILSDSGRTVNRYMTTDKGSSHQADYLEWIIENAADLGFADGLEGRRRTFEIAPGNTREGRVWQVRDDAGGAIDVAKRSILHRNPPEFIQAALFTTCVAYTDGMNEALDLKASRDMMAIEQAPSMGC
jgi:hypothetical protein